MADNILVTPGSGATIRATDQGSGVLCQHVIPDSIVATHAYAKYAESSITASFTTALTNSAKIKILRMQNLTNADLEVSFNASDVHKYIRAGDILTLDFGASGRHIASNVSVRYVTNPTAGSFIVEGDI